MVKLVLLDLDDTLLDTNMNRFLPHYFKALGEKLKDFLPPEEMIGLILKATRYMMNNRREDTTNKQAFDDIFYNELSVAPDIIDPVIEEFYEKDFPRLKIYVNKIPLTRLFVEYLFLKKMQVVIATNPLFPLRAIEHRLEWAGISDFPFKLITAYENSHFSKPNPFYYKEILDKCSAEPQYAVMIGDDEENDILPANETGIRTFRITNEDNYIYSEKGTLQQCFDWLKTIL
ncbi:MAG: HAD family hydrolase [Calditrichaceae bacterium]|nr:HAD family hydrolase [Calditrichaceae bacterium]MBN2707911.1 HAD family hydrolase [Calditrichaceae bacterium]